jgi:menaquinone-specific isochorismate synthase
VSTFDEARTWAGSISATRLAAVIVELPAVDIDALAVRGDDDDVVLWDERALDRRGAETVLLIGRAASVEASGTDRFGAIVADGKRLLDRIATFGGAKPRLFGGFSFEPYEDDAAWEAFGSASFVLPRCQIEKKGASLSLTITAPAQQIAQAGFLEGEVEQALAYRASTPPPGQARTADDSDEPFARAAEAALAEIARGHIDKVVLARRSRVVGAGQPSWVSVAARLGAELATTRFAFARRGCAFVGATPETLVELSGGRVTTEALAGSIPRRGDDLSEIETLHSSDKDLREHAFARDAIVTALSPVSLELTVSAVPSVRSLRYVHHLVSSVTARLSGPLHVVDLVSRLHPTPAMAGWPTARARRFIREHEGWSRGWYASPIGWFDGAGEGRFVVGIRSALIDETGAWVFAGAGVVAGSEPARECSETRAKQIGMLRALGVAP